MVSTVNYQSSISLTNNEIAEELPLRVKDQNSTFLDEISERETPKKSIGRRDNYDNLGLAANLIKNILDLVEPNKQMQVSVLQECKNMIDTENKMKFSKSNSANLKLRRSVKKFSNKENNSL